MCGGTQTSAGGIRTVGSKVYPRVCGGTARVGSRGSMYTGLSPRVRGNPESTYLVAKSEVYPRVCGGTAAGTDPQFQAAIGSIPACAGEPPSEHAETGGRCRSIPACAGEPIFSAGTVSKGSVYPRVCGGTP